LKTEITNDGLVSTMSLPNSFVAAYNAIGLGRVSKEFDIKVASYAEHNNKKFLSPMSERGQTFHGFLTLNPVECVEVSQVEFDNPMFTDSDVL
jgi:isocitrate lyase